MDRGNGFCRLLTQDFFSFHAAFCNPALFLLPQRVDYRFDDTKLWFSHLYRGEAAAVHDGDSALLHRTGAESRRGGRLPVSPHARARVLISAGRR